MWKRWGELFELSRGHQANVRPMEGLRGFAVFLVFLVHYVSLVTPWLEPAAGFHAWTDGLHRMGNAGVDLFFVLSGYLIYGSLIARDQGYAAFLRRRLRRIYPVFIAVFFLYLALSFAFPAESKIPSSLPQGLLYLLQNFLLLPGIFAIEPMIAVAWSLSYEMLYYLAVPLVITMFSLRRRSSTWRVAFLTVLTIVVAIAAIILERHFRLVMFMAGVLVYEAMASSRVRAPTGAVAVLVLGVALSMASLPPDWLSLGQMKVAVLFIAFFLLCLCCFLRPTEWLGVLFSWTPLRLLGNISYSYYLLHGLALKAAFLVVAHMMSPASGALWMFWLLMPPLFALTLFPSVAAFLLIEKPFSLQSGVSGFRADLSGLAAAVPDTSR